MEKNEMKEILEMINELTDKKLSDDEKMEFSHNVGDLITKAEKGIVVMTDRGVASLGRGVDILETIGVCLNHLAVDRIPDKEVWEKMFKAIIEESFKDDEDDDEEITNDDFDVEKFNNLSTKEQLDHLDKLMNKLRKLSEKKSDK
jgi:hypothetical protein